MQLIRTGLAFPSLAGIRGGGPFMLDTAADAAAAGGVAASGAIILAAGRWYWLDPAVALVIAVIITYHAQNLVRKVITVLRSP